jgi:hypothetical protein
MQEMVGQQLRLVIAELQSDKFVLATHRTQAKSRWTRANDFHIASNQSMKQPALL